MTAEQTIHITTLDEKDMLALITAADGYFGFTSTSDAPEQARACLRLVEHLQARGWPIPDHEIAAIREAAAT